MKYAGYFIRFIIHSNIFIALAAAGLTFQTQIELGLDLSLKPYLFLVFFATLFDYNLHRLNTMVFYPESLKENKYKWLRENKSLFLFIVFISVSGFILSLLFAKKEVLLMLIPFAGLTLFYTVPFYKTKGRTYKLRDLPYLKIFLISGIWAGITTLLPLAETDVDMSSIEMLNIFIIRFLFIFALSIPFDIRDSETDFRNGLLTFAHIGKGNTGLSIACILICLMSLIAFVKYMNLAELHLATAYFISGIISLIILKSKRLQSKPFYHHGFVDGAILIQTALIVASVFMRNIFCK